MRVPISSLGKSISALENRAMSIHREVTVPWKNHVRVDVLLLMDIYIIIYIDVITNEKVITNHYSSVQAAQVPQKLLAKSEHFLGGPCATAQCIASW